VISPTLAQELTRMEADLCTALTDPTRLLILYALDDRPCTVGELAQELQISQPSISRHLKVLRDRGLVHGVRQGTSIQYQLTDRRPILALDILRSLMRDRIAYQADLMETHHA
jgi:DNA-binding transcriptional ArsR family regulator